ncbi:hypothetical protein JXB02_00405 [Candidatus Woesearchaeota archaeon]|nr:hypothetical protein [Candidatus Woesearchaeota archaeon]
MGYIDSIRSVIRLAESYEHILKVKDELAKQGDAKRLYSFIRDKEFYALKDFLTEAKRIHESRSRIEQFIRLLTRKLPFLERQQDKGSFHHILRSFDTTYPRFFAVYNRLRQQLGMLRNNDLVGFLKLYDDQRRELDAIAKENRNLDPQRLYQRIRRFAGSFSRDAKSLPERVHGGFSPVFARGYLMMMIILILLSVGLGFSQERPKNAAYLMDAIKATMTHENLTPGSSSYDTYYRVYGGAGIEITDLRKDRVPDQVDIYLNEDSLASFRTTENSYFDMSVDGDSVIIAEVTAQPMKGGGWKEIRYGERTPTGRTMVNRERTNRWVRVLSDAETRKVCERINEWIFSR